MVVTHVRVDGHYTLHTTFTKPANSTQIRHSYTTRWLPLQLRQRLTNWDGGFLDDDTLTRVDDATGLRAQRGGATNDDVLAVGDATGQVSAHVQVDVDLAA